MTDDVGKLRAALEEIAGLYTEKPQYADFTAKDADEQVLLYGQALRAWHCANMAREALAATGAQNAQVQKPDVDSRLTAKEVPVAELLYLYDGIANFTQATREEGGKTLAELKAIYNPHTILPFVPPDDSDQYWIKEMPTEDQVVAELMSNMTSEGEIKDVRGAARAVLKLFRL